MLSFLCLPGLVSMAYAAGQAELKVTGRIAAAVCEPSFGPSSAIDFGTIQRSRFKGEQRLVLPQVAVPFHIRCGAALRVGLVPSDNRQHSADSQISEALGGGEEVHADDIFGLGHDGEHRMGGYQVRFDLRSLRGDGHLVAPIASSGHGWSMQHADRVRHGRINAWTEPGGRVPAAYKEVSGQLQIRPVLNVPRSMAQEASMDGSVTLELTYL